MKKLLSVLALCVLAAPGFGAGPPRVCLASIDDKGMVQLRYYHGSPVQHRTMKYVQDVDGKQEEKSATIGTRQVSEQIVTISPEAFEVFLEGKRVDAKVLKDLLPKEAPVLVVGQQLEPALLKVVKKGTLILVTLVPLDESGPPAAPAPAPTQEPIKKPS